MPPGSLTPLQEGILAVPAAFASPWMLGGGGPSPREGGVLVACIQSGATYQRLRVTDGDQTCILDLAADPVAVVEEPQRARIGGAEVLVDTPHEILVNKLCALLGRTELRELQGLNDLLAHGGDLDRALADAPRKDGGFSPLTLAYVLRGFAVEDLGRAAGSSDARIGEITAVRHDLGRRLTEAGRPPE